MPYLQLHNLNKLVSTQVLGPEAETHISFVGWLKHVKLFYDKRRFAPGGEGKDEAVGSRKVVNIYDGYIRLGRRMNLL